MRPWLEFMRPGAYLVLGGVGLTALLWFTVPLLAAAAAVATVFLLCIGAVVGLVSLGVVGKRRRSTSHL